MSIDIDKERAAFEDWIKREAFNIPRATITEQYAWDAWQTRAAIQQASTCRHRIADARNQYVESGYLCVDCGAVFVAADHTPQVSTPAAAEGQAEEEISCDQCIELAEELQKEWMRKAIAETRTAASLFDVGGFRAGMETACDEIETRMALDGDTLLEAAEGRAELIDALRAARIQVANAANGYTTSSHETNLAKRTLEKVDSALAAPLPRQAAIQGEAIAEPQNPAAWIDQFGNVFPLSA